VSLPIAAAWRRMKLSVSGARLWSIQPGPPLTTRMSRGGARWGAPKTRALYEATYFAGLRKAGMPEE